MGKRIILFLLSLLCSASIAFGADCYVDPSTGSDSTGDGTSGTPYASIEAGCEVQFTFATTSGNNIFLANTAADVLTSTIDFDGSVAKVDAPLVVQGWDNGGSITCDLPDGTTPVCGEIDGNDAVSYIADLNTSFTTFKNLKMHSTTSFGLYLNTYSNVVNCEIYSNLVGGFRNGGYGIYINNRIYPGDYTSSDGIWSSIASFVYGNNISQVDTGIYAGSNSMILMHNTVHDIDDAGIEVRGDGNKIINNTIDGVGADSGAEGIDIGFSSIYEQSQIFNNLITNFTGGAADGIIDTSTNPSTIIGNNAFYNNTDDEDLANTPPWAPANITETSDPYTDSASDDFSLVAGANSNDAAIIMNPDPSNPGNVGAWQDYSSGGGGGGSASSYTFS